MSAECGGSSRGDVSQNSPPFGSPAAPHLSLEGSGGLCAALTAKTGPQSRHTASSQRAWRAEEATAASTCTQVR